MTIHVPKWVLGGLGLVLVAVVAFLIGRSSGDDGEGAATAAGGSDQIAEEEALPCDKAAMAELIDRGGLAEAVNKIGSIAPDERVSDTFVETFSGCQDLNGDGVDELVLQISCCTAGAPDPWAIFSQADGRWQAQLVRARGSTEVKLTPEGVRETSPAYGPGDPTCCPSGKRSGLLTWDGERYVFEADPQISQPILEIENDTAASLAGFDLQNGSLPEAIDRFGTPTAYGSDDELCPAQWHDIGLVINFVNLGGQDSCGPDGRVGSVVITGTEAEHAGWSVRGSGVMVGDSQDDVRAAYPSMAPAEVQAVPEQGEDGRSWTLIDRPSPYGLSGRTMTLAARLDFGEVAALDVGVGAGGE